MVVPTPSAAYTDLTVANWTATGSPVLSDDQHNPDSCYEYDDSSNWLKGTAIEIANGSGKLSFACWIYITATDQNYYVTSSAKNPQGGMFWYFTKDAANKLTLVGSKGASFVTSNSSVQSFSAETWYHVGGTLDLGATDCNLFLAGSETSYALQDSVTGTPDTTFSSQVGQSLASFYSNQLAAGFGGIIARPHYWDDVVLTTAQFDEFHTAEVAAIGEGFPSGGQEILSPIVSQILDPAIDGILS